MFMMGLFWLIVWRKLFEECFNGPSSLEISSRLDLKLFYSFHKLIKLMLSYLLNKKGPEVFRAGRVVCL